MAKVINFSPAQQISCRYKNETATIQIIRLLNSSLGLERMVIPGGVVKFKALPEAKLEVSQFGYLTALIDEVISCKKLEIMENPLDFIVA